MATIADLDLNLLRTFVAVHDTASFTLAAARLGVPRSTVSRAIQALEDALGVALFHRTTRKVAPSSAGDALYERVADLLVTLERSLTDLPERGDDPSGVLRITAPPDLGTAVLAEAITRFVLRYPAVRVEAHLTFDIVDLVAEGYDAALRIASKPLRDSSLVAKKVGSVVLQHYASPAYIARRGVPRNLDELAHHDQLSAPRRLDRKAASTARVLADDVFFARELVLAGAVIGVLPTFFGDPEVAAGRLVRVLPRTVVFNGTAWFVVPSRKNVPSKVTAFRDLVVEILRQRPLSPA